MVPKAEKENNVAVANGAHEPNFPIKLIRNASIHVKERLPQLLDSHQMVAIARPPNLGEKCKEGREREREKWF